MFKRIWQSVFFALAFAARAPLMIFMGTFSPSGTGNYPSLVNVAAACDPDGTTADIAELLQQTNQPLLDIPWFEGNLTAGHKGAIRTGLPDAVWRQFYQGVPVSKSTTAMVTDSCGMLNARGEIDVDLANLNGNSARYRMNENYAFLEAMNQSMMKALMYGNAAVNPEQFNGIMPRFSAISGAANAQNIIDAGGTGSDNTSMLLVCWGQNTIHGIYPKGSKAGLQHRDLGEVDAQDADGNKFRAYADEWKWFAGLHVRDWRYVVRICNIDVSALTTETGAANLLKLMIKAMHRVPNLGVVQTGIQNAAANGAKPILQAPNPVFYANRTISEMLDIQALDKAAYQLKSGNDIYGRPVEMVRGVPIRTCDQILETEARVV